MIDANFSHMPLKSILLLRVVGLTLITTGRLLSTGYLGFTQTPSLVVDSLTGSVCMRKKPLSSSSINQAFAQLVMTRNTVAKVV